MGAEEQLALRRSEAPDPIGGFASTPSFSTSWWSIYGIDGALTWTVDGKQIEVGPGQALCIP